MTPVKMGDMSKKIRRSLDRTLAAIWSALVAPSSGDGCCTCGGPHADYVYYGAMEGSDLSQPDWAQCTDCHNGTDEHAVWIRSLPFERVPA